MSLFWRPRKNARHEPASGWTPGRFRPHLEPLEDRLAPATYSWEGDVPDPNDSTRGLWSNPGNWRENRSPYGDNEAFLIFPESNVARLKSHHDGPETHLSGVQFQRAGYTVSGGPIRWASGASSTGQGTNTLAFLSLFFDGSVFEHGFYPAEGNTLDVRSTIIPTFTTQPLFKGGAGKLVLSGNNTFTSGVQLEAGTLGVGSSFALGSGPLTLAGGTLESSAGYTVLDNPFNVTRSSRIVATESSDGMNLKGAEQIFENQTLRVVANSLVDLSGVISGPGRLIKAGASRLALGRLPDEFVTFPNTYTGGTVLEAGNLLLLKNGALGEGALTLEGGRLVPVSTDTIANPFEVTGDAAIAIAPFSPLSFTFSGPGSIRQGATLVVGWYSARATPGSKIVFSGRLGGAGALTLREVEVIEPGFGPPAVILSGSMANSVFGPTTIKSGILLLNKPAGVTAVAGPLVIGDGVGNRKTAVVHLRAGHQIADNVPVTIRPDGLWKLNDFDDGVGSMQDDGDIEYGDPPTLTVGFDNRSTTFGGVINGPGVLVKVGTGTWTLTGTNTFTGDTVVNGGTLVVNGVLPGPVTVAAGATLGGTGTTGPVALAAGATVSPGGSGPGVQAVHDLALAPGSSFVVQLNGVAPGTGYDQLDVTGVVRLNGATLDAALGFDPAPGDTFVIIRNDGTDPVAGTFAGLPQGAILHIGGVAFRVYYDRGDGNDVVLVRNAPPAIALLIAPTAFQNVDLALGGLRVSDPEDATLAVTLQVSHGTLTLGTIAGLTVSGNGTSAVSLVGGVADLNAALASLIYRSDHNYSGSDALAVAATDGLDGRMASLVLRVKSLAEQAADLQAQVSALSAAGVLNQGQSNSLIVKLNLKNNTGDVGRVEAFLNEVDALLSGGILSPAQANSLLGPGNVLLLGLRRR